MGHRYRVHSRDGKWVCPSTLAWAIRLHSIQANVWLVATHFRSYPIDGSELVPGCSFNSFYLFVFFKSVAARILSPTRMADLNRSPVYSDRFHLSYQNILFMSFRFKVFNYAEAVSNGRPINIYFYTICLQNGVSCLYKMIYKTIV